MVRNARYLLLPWVTLPHLASHALGLVARQLPQDPQHHGTCYRAAGWRTLGRTRGTPASGTQPARTPKQVRVRQLQPNFREILRQAPPKPAQADAAAPIGLGQ